MVTTNALRFLFFVGYLPLAISTAAAAAAAAPPTPSDVPPSVHFFSGESCTTNDEFASFPLEQSEIPTNFTDPFWANPDPLPCNPISPPDNYTGIGATGCPKGVETHLMYFSNSECKDAFSRCSGKAGEMVKGIVGVCWPPPIENKLRAVQIWCGDVNTALARPTSATSLVEATSSSVSSTTDSGASSTVSSDAQETSSSVVSASTSQSAPVSTTSAAAATSSSAVAGSGGSRVVSLDGRIVAAGFLGAVLYNLV